MLPKEAPVDFGYWDNHGFGDPCGWLTGRDDTEGVQIRDRFLLERLKNIRALNGQVEDAIATRIRRGEIFHTDRHPLGTVVRLEREYQSGIGPFSTRRCQPNKYTFFGIVAKSITPTSEASRMLMVVREGLVLNNDRHPWFAVLPGDIDIGAVRHTRYSGDGLFQPRVDRLDRVRWLDVLRV